MPLPFTQALTVVIGARDEHALGGIEPKSRYATERVRPIRRAISKRVGLHGEVRRLLEALDLPFDPDCLTFHESRRDARTASVDQVRRPIYRSSVRRSDRYRPWLGPLLDGLGDLDNLPPAPSLVSLAHTGE